MCRTTHVRFTTTRHVRTGACSSSFSGCTWSSGKRRRTERARDPNSGTGRHYAFSYLPPSRACNQKERHGQFDVSYPEADRSAPRTECGALDVDTPTVRAICLIESPSSPRSARALSRSTVFISENRLLRMSDVKRAARIELA